MVRNLGGNASTALKVPVESTYQKCFFIERIIVILSVVGRGKWNRRYKTRPVIPIIPKTTSNRWPSQMMYSPKLAWPPPTAMQMPRLIWGCHLCPNCPRHLQYYRSLNLFVKKPANPANRSKVVFSLKCRRHVYGNKRSAPFRVMFPCDITRNGV